MKRGMVFLGVFLMVLCTAPVYALFADDDIISAVWCPLGGYPLEGPENNILVNDFPNAPPVIPVLVEDAKYGHVWLFKDGRVSYVPGSVQWDRARGMDTFRYRTFDGTGYSNDATVHIFLVPNFRLYHGEELKFSTPKDTMLSAQILDDEEWVYSYRMEADYSNPAHGILTPIYGGYWEGDDYTVTGQTPYFHYLPEPGFEGIDRVEYSMSIDTGECGTMWGMPGTIEITVGDVNPVPEFPSRVLPVIFVIGFLGTVLFIHRTREH